MIIQIILGVLMGVVCGFMIDVSNFMRCYSCDKVVKVKQLGVCVECNKKQK